VSHPVTTATLPSSSNICGVLLLRALSLQGDEALML
jgi:hypothetical protein